VNSNLPPSGLILLDKTAGVTSCNALFPIRKIFKTRRVGHAGSLDLRASGLIVAAVGRATRLLPFVEAGEKTYSFTAHFGYSTVTDEWDGELLEQDEDTTPISEDEVRQILPQFVGEIDQVPPDFSAIKLNGKRASDLKRKGRDVELKARKITIRDLRFEGLAEVPAGATGKIRSSYKFSCDCSKGTYIRSLAYDIGKVLGCGAHLIALERTQAGKFKIENSVKLENLDIATNLINPLEVLSQAQINVNSTELTKIKNGVAFHHVGTPDGTVLLVHENNICAVGFSEDNLISLKKVFL